MYVLGSLACSLPNSQTPMSPERIAAQNRRVARVGQKFDVGNAALDNIMARLSPPIAAPSCGMLLTSDGLRIGSPFPEPGGGPAPTIAALSSPRMLPTWFDQWARGPIQPASYGTIMAPTVGGAIPGATSWPGSPGVCRDPVVLEMATIFPVETEGGQVVMTPAAAPSSPDMSVKPFLLLGLLGLGAWAVLKGGGR